MTHLQLRDGSLLPLNQLYIKRDRNRVIFRLTSGDEIKEEYISDLDAMNALASYSSIIMNAHTLTSITLIDTVNSLPSTITVENGVVTVDQ